MEANIYEQIVRKSKEFNSFILTNPQFLEHIITKDINIQDFELIKTVLLSVEEIEENNKISDLYEL